MPENSLQSWEQHQQIANHPKNEKRIINIHLSSRPETTISFQQKAEK